MSDIVILINSLGGGGAERVVSTLLNELCFEYECYLILLENNIDYPLDNRINVICLNEDVNFWFSEQFLCDFFQFHLLLL